MAKPIQSGESENQKELDFSHAEEAQKISEDVFVTTDIRNERGKSRYASRKPKMTKRQKNRRDKNERKAAKAKWSATGH